MLIHVSENWMFEVKVVRAIRTKKYGTPWSALSYISITDGEASVESAIAKSENDWTKYDTLEIESCLKVLGFKHYHYSRYNKHGVKKMVKKKLV